MVERVGSGKGLGGLICTMRIGEGLRITLGLDDEILIILERHPSSQTSQFRVRIVANEKHGIRRLDAEALANHILDRWAVRQ